MEAIEYLYSANNFLADDNVVRFLPLVMLPQRINSIRSLRVIWRIRRTPPLGPQVDTKEVLQRRDERRWADWTTIWHTLSTMSNLQSLHVKLQVLDFYWGYLNPESSTKLLGPIKKVTIPENFTLSLPFPAMNGAVMPPVAYSWCVGENWEGSDPWDELPCIVERTGYI